MSFFSTKKKTTPAGGAKGSKHTITLQCPDCGHEQTESKMAVSTYCRSCSVPYKIINGKAAPNKATPSNPLTPLKNTAQTPKLRAPEHTADNYQKDSSNDPNEGQEPTPPQPRSLVTSLIKKVASGIYFIQKAAASTGLYKLKEKERAVRCFECERIHSTCPEASSTLCPGCGAYIALKSYDIRTNWNRRIQTRGDVVIHKKASVTGITIHCHHLTLLGKFTGGADCSGDFIIRSHGKIMGEVRCKRLIIQKKAQVEFANTVHCEDAIIDGNVIGHFECSGKFSLQKKATLTGDIKVATMAIQEGARHNGRVSIGQ